jgi:hypothetical protein
LPENYEEAGRLDLGRNKLMAILLNVVALFATLGFAFVFLRLAAWFRGAAAPRWGELTFTGTGALWAVLEVLVLSVVTVVVHELLHAVGFRAYTGERATFGFKGLYAYAGAPDWYLPRNQHLVTLLLPFVTITVVGTLLLAVMPAPLLSETVLVLILNAAGAVGDLVALVWLLTKPRHALINDYGDGLVVFAKSRQS